MSEFINSQAQLDPKDQVQPLMVSWCLDDAKGSLVVMNSGKILTTKRTSPMVQNCRVVMQQKGLEPRQVLVADPKVIEGLLFAVEADDQETLSDQELSVTQEQLRSLVSDALNAQVSDVHIEVREDICHVRFRKDGDMVLYREWPAEKARRLCFVAFNKESDHLQHHFNPLVPQDAAMQLKLDNGTLVRIRLASIPTHPQPSFDVTLRVLTSEDLVPSLSELGYTDVQESLLRKAMQRPHGAILISGPTGSGKTTTLSSCLNLLPDRQKIYTIEDPVEKIVANASQVPVNTDKDNRSFANMTRQTLRMDPDCVTIGEVRDADTATMLARAAVTGHLVLSTVHTNSAVNIITRLSELGLSPTLLADPNFLVLLVFQRLIKKLCATCSIPLSESKRHQPYLESWKNVFGDAIQQMRANGNNINCLTCEGKGVKGRIVISEVIWVDLASRAFIQNKDTLGWENYLNEQGLLSCREHAKSRVISGEVDVLDAEALVGHFDETLNQDRFDYAEFSQRLHAGEL